MKEKNKKEPLDWIHKVREENYKKTKKMSSKQYVEYIGLEAKKVLNEIAKRKKKTA